MEDALISILESFKYPVFRQGSFSGSKNAYPDTFITYWNLDSPDNSYYDNGYYGTDWSFSVYIYSKNPATVYSVTEAVRTALKQAGWIVSSKGYDVASGEPTHTARGLNVQFADF